MIEWYRVFLVVFLLGWVVAFFFADASNQANSRASFDESKRLRRFSWAGVVILSIGAIGTALALVWNP